MKLVLVKGAIHLYHKTSSNMTKVNLSPVHNKFFVKMAKLNSSKQKLVSQKTAKEAEVNRSIDTTGNLYDENGQIKDLDKLLDLLEASEPTEVKIPQKYLDSETKMVERIKKSAQVSQKYLQTEIKLQR
jgi:hypothetical protein